LNVFAKLFGQFFTLVLDSGNSMVQDSCYPTETHSGNYQTQNKTNDQITHDLPLFSGCRLTKQDTKQDVQSPSLQPSNFFDTHNSINQATIPQHVNRPTEQETQEDQEHDAADDGNKCFK
jgi:hypothetical protein